MATQSENPLRVFHNIVSEQNVSFSEKVKQLLSFGIKLFGLEIGIVSKVRGNDYEVVQTVNRVEGLDAGTHFQLEDTYCQYTLRQGETVGFHFVGKSEIGRHPCYQAQKLEAYLASPIYVDNEIFGTINFSSPNAVKPFDSYCIDYIELIAQWLGSELSRQKFINSLTVQATTLTKLEKVGKIGTWSVDLLTGEIVWSAQTRLIHEADTDYQPEMESAIAFYVEEDQNKIHDVVKRAIENGEPWDLKAQIVTGKGRRRWVVTKGDAEFSEGRCTRLFGTFQDITNSVRDEQKLKEAKSKAEQATQAKSEFLANMSHEIRTPMNGVLGTLQLLEKANIDDRSKLLISKAKISASSLLIIINDILDYSKIEAKQLSFELQPFSMLEVMESVQSDLSLNAGEKQIELRTQTSKDYIDGWEGDIVRVRQILLNLVSNAVKFTERGEVVIRLSNGSLNGQRTLCMQVSDTGIGMSKEAKARIFERFSQADSSTTRRFGGTGLGMSISVSLISMMNGKIDVKSNTGEGTVVDVTLPLKPVSALQKREGNEDQPAPNLKGTSLLIAEDNDINRLIIESMLAPTYAKLYFAKTGLEAVEIVSEHRIDLILMDIQMPEMDGVRAFHEIRKGDNATPIIALTANVMKEEVNSYLRIGFVEHLAKPVNIPALYKALRRYIISAD